MKNKNFCEHKPKLALIGRAMQLVTIGPARLVVTSENNFPPDTPMLKYGARGGDTFVMPIVKCPFCGKKFA